MLPRIGFSPCAVCGRYACGVGRWKRNHKPGSQPDNRGQSQETCVTRCGQSVPVRCGCAWAKLSTSRASQIPGGAREPPRQKMRLVLVVFPCPCALVPLFMCVKQPSDRGLLSRRHTLPLCIAAITLSAGDHRRRPSRWCCR